MATRFRAIGIVFFALLIAAGSYLASFALRFDFRIPFEYQVVLVETLPILLICKAIGFWSAGLHGGWWRHVSLGDVKYIVRATAVATLLFLAAIVLSRGLLGFPRSIFLLDFVLCTVAIGGVRLLLRILRERSERGPLQRIEDVAIVVGAGHAGIRLREEMQRSFLSHTQVAGFVDDDPRKLGLRIDGCRVLGSIGEIPALVEKHGVTKVMVAIPSATGHLNRRVLKLSQEAGVPCQVLPSLGELEAGRVFYNQLREVNVHDLLAREPVVLGARDIRSLVGGRTVLVTGAAGSIGSELCRQIAASDPRKLILFDRHENGVFALEANLVSSGVPCDIVPILGDILLVDQLRGVFREQRPDLVFHAAAYKHVTLAEKNPVETVLNNVIGTRNVVDAAVESDVAEFVLVSTDKAVSPTSVMGLTKRVAERIVQGVEGARGRFIAVRFGNVLDSNGSVVPIFRKQIRSGGPVTVTHPEASRFFMTIPEAVQLILRAAALETENEIILLEMGEPVRIEALARNMIELSGLSVGGDIEIEYIGLRPGEKLHEALVHRDEKQMKTAHGDIKVLQGAPVFRDIRGHVAAIESALESEDLRGAFDRLREIVPDYRASESISALIQRDTRSSWLASPR